MTNAAENPLQTAFEQQIARELSLRPAQVSAVCRLLNEGATVPFIARYRKEQSGSLDEVQITQIRDRLHELEALEKRRAFILESIAAQGKLTPELQTALEQATTLSVLEDLYLPYKPKRRTRASIAREKGLEPLAQLLYEQKNIDITTSAAAFVSAEKGVADTEEALAGARDIIAEWINEDADTRAVLRKLFFEKGVIASRIAPLKEEQALTYKDYFDWKEPIKRIPSHRMLAILRGTNEDFLRLSIEPEEEEALFLIAKKHLKGANAASKQVQSAISDSYKRLLQPSLETEIRNETKARADREAIAVFAENLRHILLASPLGEKRVLAIDPGFRTGCKVAILNEQGTLLENSAIYPFSEDSHKKRDAVLSLHHWCKKYEIEAIAVGNGTAGKETAAFLKSIDIPEIPPVVMVNESGASIYSASEVAREEFPNLDLTVRGAVSIGRRLMDPLAEIVKIDPKSIGVGQYQHDVEQNALKQSLDDTVMSCVNAVGVEVNTASKQLLMYVSGLGPQLAQNIVTYREQVGAFKSRSELKKVPRLGEKAFEQAAGFLRIRQAANPLDASAVHPERYILVEKMAKDAACSVQDLIKNADMRKRIDIKRYVNAEVGLPTLQDIMNELAKPGRDPRGAFEAPSFRSDLNSIEDLYSGLVLNGIVTNVTNFGAFVDVGVHQDGMVHISQMSNRFIKDPKEVVKVGQNVQVKVLEVDIARKRIYLTMKEI
ncbi:MAG: RNA-binding transcriptional accessory protein [Sphingobacteriales bacterium]|nr:RNA-binding transcriptional accessory protein [Sphingobacteriales bacterium]